MRLQLVAPGVRLMSVQLTPLLSERRIFCPAAAAWLSVPLMVCKAVWVMKSVPDAPVSALKLSWEMLGGAALSTVMLLLLTSDRLPARSLAYNT